MKTILIAICVFFLTVRINTVAAQTDSTRVMMNTFMAKDPGGNASPANISMWPNPAKGSVNVYLNTVQPGDRGQCVIYNNSGTACIVANLQNGNNRIYFSALPEGYYFLNIKLHDNIVFSKKLIVSRVIMTSVKAIL
jgi:hypothetical protein